MHIILASASKRRSDLMNIMGLDFSVEVSECDENVEIVDPVELVKTLALKKACAVKEKHGIGFAIVGADTVVTLDGEIIGKPKDKPDAFKILKRLSGKTHTVYTGIALLTDDKEFLEYDSSEVTFSQLTDDEIISYIETGEPMDKAGAYGLQGRFSVFVTKIVGSYFTIVGLPVHTLYAMLKKAKSL
ncbi:MAG: Maf family protein [Clostridia bacterium]